MTPPNAGVVKLFGEQIRSERAARRVRPSIGYLPQEFGYYPAFSAYEFVRYCSWLREVPARQAREATLAALAAVGLAERAKVKMRSLSAGMVRRVGIAAAIVGSPRLLLLDEPTASLDPAQRVGFRDLIRSMRDTAVVLSTHLVEDVAAICDEVAIMSDGRFLFRGHPSALAAVAAQVAGPARAAGDTALERGYLTVLKDGQVLA